MEGVPETLLEEVTEKDKEGEAVLEGQVETLKVGDKVGEAEPLREGEEDTVTLRVIETLVVWDPQLVPLALMVWDTVPDTDTLTEPVWVGDCVEELESDSLTVTLTVPLVDPEGEREREGEEVKLLEGVPV